MVQSIKEGVFLMTLRECKKNTNHWYSDHLTTCPWCEIYHTQRIEYFPGSVKINTHHSSVRKNIHRSNNISSPVPIPTKHVHSLSIQEQIDRYIIEINNLQQKILTARNRCVIETNKLQQKIQVSRELFRSLKREWYK